jgi:RNA polymerase sigma-70 factor (ECF subfamily)
MALLSTSSLPTDTSKERARVALSRAPSLASAAVSVNDLKPDDWERHIRRYGHEVILSLLALGLPIDKAEEIAQAAWTKLLSQHKAGRLSEIRLPGLAITQARFLAMDYLRREGRTEALDSADHHPNLEAGPSSNPQRTALARSEVALALTALGTCSQNGQRIFKLFYVDGENARNIAEELGLSTQRVRQLLCEVRSVLRTATEEES